MATNDEYNSLKYINIETGNDLMDLKKNAILHIESKEYQIIIHVVFKS